MLEFAPRVVVLTRIGWLGEALIAQLEACGFRARHCLDMPDDGLSRNDVVIGDSAVVTPQIASALRQQTVVVLHFSHLRERIEYPPSVQHLDPTDNLSSLLHLVKPARPSASQSALTRLTTRQREVLDRASRGETNAEIAAALVVTVGTVKRHLHDVYHSLVSYASNSLSIS